MSGHVDQAVWEWLRGELPPAPAAEVQAHLDGCVACANKAEQARTALSLLAKVEDVPRPPREFWERLDEKVLGALPARRRALGWSGLWTSAVARAAALGAFAIALALGASLFLRPAPEQGVTLQWAGASEPRRVSTGEWVDTGAHSAVAQLPEGSVVELASGTRARFAEASPHSVRVSLEQGSVRVDATHREGRRFVVVSGDVEVAVVGTRFLVVREGSETVVQVFEGRVEVRRGQEVLALSAGQKARVGNTELALVTEPTKYAPADFEVPELTEPTPSPGAPSSAAPPEATPPPKRQEQRVAMVEPLAAAPSQPRDSVAKLSDEEPEPIDAPASADAGAPAAHVSDALGAPMAGVAPGPTGPPAKARPRAPQPWAERLFGGSQKWANVDWLSDVVPPGVSEKEYRARQLVFLADAGRCQAVDTRAQRWLNLYAREDPKDAPTRDMARDVRFTWARCLEKLGRKDEAAMLREPANAQ